MIVILCNGRVRPCPGNEICSPTNKRTPWNKGKLIGARPPLRPKHVWSIGTLDCCSRGEYATSPCLTWPSIASFAAAMSWLSKSRHAPNGYTMDRATVRQKKTRRPVKFGLTDQTRLAIDDYLKAAGSEPGEFLFTGRRGFGHCLTTRQYAGSFGMDRQHRPRPQALWHAFAPANKGNVDLSPNRKSTSRAALAWPHQNRKHRQIPRHRGR